MEVFLKMPELLAPAGNLEKLATALLYGADAVYLGVERFSLRSQAGNLALQDLGRACEIVHASGGRAYLTLNAFLRPGEEDDCRRFLADLRPMPVDAYIVADPGMLSLVRDIDPDRELHLSTQANTCNAAAAQFWQSAGVKRLNLARELTLEEIRAVRAGTQIELEVFVHGAMCVAYSGRCLLSAALTGRSANQGECAQSCRWEYRVEEAKRPGDFHPIEEDERGTYLFNSYDLCLIEHLPELIKAGVNSLKIEGRMKSAYYVAAVTRVYRAALDAYRDDPRGYRFDPEWLRELEKVSHRPYGAGFLFGNADARIHPEDSGYRRSTDFVGVVLDDGGDNGWLVQGRNRFESSEQLELIGPGMRQAYFKVPTARTQDDSILTVVQPNSLVYLDLPQGSRKGDILRREHG
ncbi:MAG: U32 family peptidase [Desulfuromonadales bacterium]|nr:U32 family peptidase [Desulfuromonadales bacterium]